MKRILDYAWPIIGIAAVIFSGWLLFHELNTLSADAILQSLSAIPAHRWALAALSTLAAYAALAWYDRIALLHLGKAGFGLGLYFPCLLYDLCFVAQYWRIGAFWCGDTLPRLFNQRIERGRDWRVGSALFVYLLLGTILLAGIVLLIEPDFCRCDGRAGME